LSLRRNLGNKEVEEWDQMMTMLEGISLTERTDTVAWMLEKSDNLTTKSVYKMVTFPGIFDLRIEGHLGNQVTVED
jgi:hypothetical protein